MRRATEDVAEKYRIWREQDDLEKGVKDYQDGTVVSVSFTDGVPDQHHGYTTGYTN